MEKTVSDQMARVMQQPGTLGVTVADGQGLCLGHLGTLTETTAGTASLLYQRATALLHEDDPTVVITTDRSTWVAY